MKPTAKLVPATKEHVKVLYPEGVYKTFRGITALIDGEPVAIGGLYREQNEWMLFARILNELRPYKLTIYKASLRLKALMEETDKPIYSIADPSIKGSDDLLLHMGFEYIGKDWYVWTS